MASKDRDAEPQSDNDGVIKMDPDAAARSDGWVTDTTPNPEPQHVIDRNARESAEALRPSPGPTEIDINAVAPERPLAPGVLEHSTESTVQRAEEQEAARRAGAAQQPTPRQP
jgi:hypothetical protein